MADLSKIKTYLSVAGVSAIVSTRVYPVITPKNPTPPYIVYREVSNVPQNVLAAEDAPIDRSRIQIDCYARQFSEVQTMKAAVRAALVAYGKVLVGQDLFEEETRLHRSIIDFSWHD